jgi:hypothetical protein
MKMNRKPSIPVRTWGGLSGTIKRVRTVTYVDVVWDEMPGKVFPWELKAFLETHIMGESKQ